MRRQRTSAALRDRRIAGAAAMVVAAALGPGGCRARTPVAEGDRPVCGDLLAEYAQPLPHVEFLGCEPGTGQVLVTARYRVSGGDAAEAERLLHERHGMARLRFACCGWEPAEDRRGTFAPCAGELSHSVYMYSGETLVDARERWSEIEEFFVVAEILRI